jgi:hypothetical protein
VHQTLGFGEKSFGELVAAVKHAVARI